MVIPTGLRWLTLRIRPDKSASVRIPGALAGARFPAGWAFQRTNPAEPGFMRLEKRVDERIGVFPSERFISCPMSNSPRPDN